jgi:hypothetical protein
MKRKQLDYLFLIVYVSFFCSEISQKTTNAESDKIIKLSGQILF